MPSIQGLGLVLLAATGAVAVINTSVPPQLNVETVYGCYSDFGDLISNGTNIFNSKGHCATKVCKNSGYPVAATMGGNECYCGKTYPSKQYKVDDSECDIACVGYPEEACGGIMKWTIYNTGLSLAIVANDEVKPTRAGSGSNSEETKPTATAAGTTVVVTQPPKKEEKSSNTGAIAGGVVVGVLALASLVGGILFYLRRKRNREIEEEHRRNAVNSFTGKTPSLTDSRLDPVMAQRRMSDGSIADNHDYSRKILRVTNA
ncbi:putative wsc domain-containing protein [Podospora conica]|nr:putative wsc domain-containing protein [Schizothecium conicum]